MSKKILQVVESAYRANFEEQDDPVLWLTAVLKGAGAPVDVLLRGAAVSYAARTQDASGLVLGAWTQKNPPDIVRDLARLREKGANVYVLEDELDRRGIRKDELVEGLAVVKAEALPTLFAGYDQIWAW